MSNKTAGTPPSTGARQEDENGETVELRPQDVIKLDKTRTVSAPGPGTTGPVRIPDFSTVHGDRRPDDPHYAVSYMQDGLPFDNEGNLVPDDGKTEAYAGLPDENNKPVIYRPLYSKAMREKVKRRMERHIALMKIAPPTVGDLHEDVNARDEASEGVNLPLWLRGEAEYQPFMVYAAIKQRYGRNVGSLAPAVRLLVEEENVVVAGALREDFKRYLRTSIAA